MARADGGRNQEIAARLETCAHTVGKWRRRFAEHGMDGLRDDPRTGAPRGVDDARIETVVTATLESVPKGATHWTSRAMARDSGLSVSTVQRIWRAFGLQPQRPETFKPFTDGAQLKEAIATFIDQHNVDPKPFRWTKSASDILASIERFRVRNTPGRGAIQ